MQIRFYCDSPLLPASFGRHDPKSYLLESFDERLEHINFMRNPSHPFIPRELFLFLEKSYARETQFGSENHFLLVHHIAQLIYEVSRIRYNCKKSTFATHIVFYTMIIFFILK